MEAVEAVGEGLRHASDLYAPCQFYQIITCLRDFGSEEAQRMCSLAMRAGADQRVVGVDLAGNEHAHPPELFVEAFTSVFEQGSLGITIHAGEGTAEECAQNIKTSVELLHATRIGHGVAAKYSDSVRQLLKRQGVALEICPTSNVHTGSISCVGEHPARLFRDAGLLVVPCCDNSLLSRTDTAEEYRRLEQEGVLTGEELQAVAVEAHSAAFVKH
jgi:adenosine deaminase